MEKQQLINYLKEQNIQKVKFAFADVDGILRGKTISTKKFLDGLNDGFGFCDVVFGWDSNDTLIPGGEITGWQTGYPDQTCQIDLSTFRTIPWQNELPFFLADFSLSTGSASNACSRTLLKKIIKDCEDLGFHPEFAQEFEWFNFLENPQSAHEKSFQNLKPISQGMYGYSVIRPALYSDFNEDLFQLLAKFNINLEGLHTETGPGVYEAAITHDYALHAADKAVLFKSSAKEIAYKHGVLASFMAKFNNALPGCSGHIHQSLWNKPKTENLFFDAADTHSMSDTFKQYLAGQLHCLPYILPLLAPTINSYKRLVEGAWAPTTVTWGFENRTTALRVINSSYQYTRLEMRVPGADTNPYLAMAASLASGLYGIKNKLTLTTEAANGNAYENLEAIKLPANLFQAATAMENSTVAHELFGGAFVKYFCKTRFWEWEQFNKHVTDWELKRYFEII